MNKSELVEAVAAKTGLSKADTERTLNIVFDTIVDAVAAGDSVNVLGFGAFKPVERDAREGRNPATGETIRIDASRIPKFVPGKGFKDRVNA